MHRLLAACGVMAALAIVIAISAGDYGRPSGATPAFLGAGAVCAALVAYLLAASARAVGDPRLVWMAAGSAVACAGLFASILGLPTIFPTGGTVDAPGTSRIDVADSDVSAAALVRISLDDQLRAEVLS